MKQQKKKDVLRKDFYMEVKKSLGRFLSIFFIVALGVAFYTGIRSGEPSMKITGDKYFDNDHLMDVKVIGTMGLTENDIKALEAIDGIEQAEGSYSKDVLCPTGETNKVVHILAMQVNFNNVTVSEGRLPAKSGECLIDDDFAKYYQFKLGDQVTFKSGDDTEITDSMTTDTFTIVGFGNTPLYVSFGRGNTLIGNGEVSGFVIVDKSSFDMNVYTEAYLKVAGAEAETAFTAEHEKILKAAVEAVEGIADTQCKIRKSEVVTEASKEIADAEKTLEEESKKLEDAKAQLADARSTAESELEKAKKELENGASEIASSQAQIDDGWKQIRDGLRELDEQQNTLNESAAQVEDGFRQLNEKEQELLEGEAQYEAEKPGALAKIEEGEQQLADARAQAEAASGLSVERTISGIEAGLTVIEVGIEGIDARIAATDPERTDLIEMLEKTKAELVEQKSNLEEQAAQLQQIIDGEAQIKAARDELEAAGEAIQDGKRQIAENRALLEDSKAQIADGQRQIDEARTLIRSKESELRSGQKSLDAGVSELEKGKKEYDQAVIDTEKELGDAEKKSKDGEEELISAKQKIMDAKAEIARIENPKWYVWDRGEALGDYDGFGENADRMRSLGRVFPVLFFLVAALISLTTMTRMVEEQRVQIGTLKALGYSKGAIVKKYVSYALLATVGGSILGFLVGEKILPFIIVYAYGIMYQHIPAIYVPYHLGYAFSASFIAIVCVLAATIFSCYRELASEPAVLMRPPAPKIGRKILLERIPVIWKRLNFTWKSSVRNLIRYKKRLFMTVFGIGGCMALMLVGFGLKDCIYEIVELQFERIQFYDASAFLDDEIDSAERKEILAELADNKDVNCYVQARMQKLKVVSASGKQDLYLFVPQDSEEIENMIDFHSRVGNEVYHLKDQQVIITEKVAELLKVKAGDTVTIKDEDYGDKEVVVDAVCENYMGNYLYLSPEKYEEVYGAPEKNNAILYQMKEDAKDKIEDVGISLLKNDHVINVSYTASITERLDDMLASLNMVIVVLIISAGMLAFVVLYNLNNINITERQRELATLKVLGFYDKEVASYVFRENIVLTVIGAFVGMLMGFWLLRYVIVTVEVEEAMFGRSIHFISYVYGFLFTILFSLIINLIMNFKLKRIDMVESLKSVE